MELAIGEQALALLMSAALGAMLGVLYDFFRAVRYALGKAGAAVCDVLFCLVCALSLFWLVMRSAQGTLGTWVIPLLGAGALLYFASVSAFVLRAAEKTIGMIRHTANIGAEIFKKVFSFLNMHFQNAKKCFIIKK